MSPTLIGPIFTYKKEKKLRDATYLHKPTMLHYPHQSCDVGSSKSVWGFSSLRGQNLPFFYAKRYGLKPVIISSTIQRRRHCSTLRTI